MANFQTTPKRSTAVPPAPGGERITEAESLRRPDSLTPNWRRGRRVWVIGGLIVLAILAAFVYWIADSGNQAGVPAQQGDATPPASTAPAAGDTSAGVPPAPAATSQ
jgi:hypothetical protein